MSDIPLGALRDKVFHSGESIVYFKEDVFVFGDQEYPYHDIADFVKDASFESKYRIDLHTGISLEVEIVEDCETFEEIMVEKAVDDEDEESEDGEGPSGGPGGKGQGGTESSADSSLPSISDHLDMEEERAVEEQILRDEEDRLKKELASAQEDINRVVVVKDDDDEVKDVEDPKEEEKKGEEEEEKEKKEEKEDYKEEEKKGEEEDDDDDDDEYDEEIERMLREEAELNFQKEKREERGETVDEEVVEEEEPSEKKVTEEVEEPSQPQDPVSEEKPKEEEIKTPDNDDDEEGGGDLDDDDDDDFLSGLADPDDIMKKLEMELEDAEKGLGEEEEEVKSSETTPKIEVEEEVEEEDKKEEEGKGDDDVDVDHEKMMEDLNFEIGDLVKTPHVSSEEEEEEEEEQQQQQQVEDEKVVEAVSPEEQEVEVKVEEEPEVVEVEEPEKTEVEAEPEEVQEPEKRIVVEEVEGEKPEEPETTNDDPAVVEEEEEEEVLKTLPQQQQQQPSSPSSPSRKKKKVRKNGKGEFKVSKVVYDLFETHYLYPKSTQRLFSLHNIKNRVIQVSEDTIMDDKTMVSLMLESLLMSNLDPKTFKIFNLVQEKQKDEERITKWRVLKIRKSQDRVGGLFMGTESRGVLDTLSNAFHDKVDAIDDDDDSDIGFACKIMSSRYHALNPLDNKTFEFRLEGEDDLQPLFYGTLVFEVSAVKDEEVKDNEDNSANTFDKLFGKRRISSSYKKAEKVSKTNNIHLVGIHYRFSLHPPSTHFYFCDDDSSSLPPFFELTQSDKLTKSVVKDLEYEIKLNITFLRRSLSSPPSLDDDDKKKKFVESCLFIEKVMKWSVKSRKVLELTLKYFISLWSIIRKLVSSSGDLINKTHGLRMLQVLLGSENLMNDTLLKPENSLYLEETLFILFNIVVSSPPPSPLNDLVKEVSHEFIMKYPVTDNYAGDMLTKFLTRQLSHSKNKSQLLLTLRILQLVFFTKKRFFSVPKMSVLLTHLKNLYDKHKRSDDMMFCEEIINVILNVFFFCFYRGGGKGDDVEEDDDDVGFEMNERKRMILCIFADSESSLLKRIRRSINERIKI